MKQLETVKSRLRELNKAGKEQASVWGRMASSFNKYFGIVTAGIASITGLSFAFRKLAEDVYKVEYINLVTIYFKVFSC